MYGIVIVTLAEFQVARRDSWPQERNQAEHSRAARRRPRICLSTAAAAAAAPPPRAQHERATARHTAAASAHTAVRERAGAAVEWRERMKRPAQAREGDRLGEAGVCNVHISR